MLGRSDEDPAERQAMVEEFVGLAATARIFSPSSNRSSAHRARVRYSTRRPRCCLLPKSSATPVLTSTRVKCHLAAGAAMQNFSRHAELDACVTTPWVISSGVEPDLFPNAVRQAVTAGAIGFLAGRAVWSCTLPFADPTHALHDLAAPRLERLGQIVDEALALRIERLQHLNPHTPIPVPIQSSTQRSERTSDMNWIGLPAHTRWLETELDRILEFGRLGKVGNGFGWISNTGGLREEQGVQLWITARMVHTFSAGYLMGRPAPAEHGRAWD